MRGTVWARAFIAIPNERRKILALCVCPGNGKRGYITVLAKGRRPREADKKNGSNAEGSANQDRIDIVVRKLFDLGRIDRVITTQAKNTSSMELERRKQRAGKRPQETFG